MRLIGIINKKDKALAFSKFLTSKGIENELEQFIVDDWGSDDYGTIQWRVWIQDEDKVDEAKELLNIFHQNPHAKLFNEPILSSTDSTHTFNAEKKILYKPKQQGLMDNLGIITRFILIVCVVLFIYGMGTIPQIKKIPENIPLTPIFTPKINKHLLIDYPKAFDLLDTLIEKYGLKGIQNPQLLPPKGQKLLQTFYHTPYWTGLYDKLVLWFQGKQITDNAPLFEKIRQGQIWRLFTPCLLHANLLHIFFNMIWLIVLGKQMEKRMTAFRYIAFILATGIFSNISQYLMSGANFIGYSGVLSAMITFVWVRQKKAPWEGYQMDKATFNFVAAFILGIFAIQLISFFMEITIHKSIPLRIANTAHLSGAFIGIVFGYTKFFAKKL